MSKHSKGELVDRVLLGVRRSHVDQDLFDDLAAERLGVNRTDLRVLDVLGQEGPLPAGDLAEQSGLSRPAMTASIDRLEAVGYVRRTHTDEDRRRVTIEVTPRVMALSGAIWGPLAIEAHEDLSRLTIAELKQLLDFLDRSARLSARHRERLLADSAAGD